MEEAAAARKRAERTGSGDGGFWGLSQARDTFGPSGAEWNTYTTHMDPNKAQVELYPLPLSLSLSFSVIYIDPSMSLFLCSSLKKIHKHFLPLSK
jgi:hypothetical protein